MKRNLLLFVLVLTIYGLVLCSCRKFLEIEPAPQLVVSEKVFANESSALSALSGVYAQMRFSNRALTNSGLSLFGGLLADELAPTAPNATSDPFYTNSLLSNNSVVTTDFWASAYANIYRINAILEALPMSQSIPETSKRQFTGEMKFCRAFYYFYLVNLFGDVPLVTGTDYAINAATGRTKADSIYSFIIRELSTAKQLLPVTYAGAQRSRPNQFAAAALLARTYLFKGQWEAAITAATEVIQSGAYSIPANLVTSFQISSNEVIWQIASDNSNTAEGTNFLTSSATTRPQHVLTPSLLQLFEGGDLRKSQWINKNTVGGIDYYYPAKYKVRTSTPISEFNIALRLAEVYLIRAEAHSRLNHFPEACSDLNQVRARAGLSPLQTTNAAMLEASLAKERQTEFFAEWGHRWLDLKRTGKADPVLSVIKGSNWHSTDVLLPIPFSQLQVNPNLTQNPGY